MFHLRQHYIAVILLVLIFSALPGMAYPRQAISRPSFCGGMFYQVGWSRIQTPAGTVSGISRGLGGKLGFYVSPSLRLGAMGFSGSLRYDKNVHSPSSHISMSAGGLNAELVRHLRSVAFSAGIMLGGGRIEHLHIMDVGAGSNTVSYNDYSTFLIAPMLSLEYPLSEKITVTVTADWLLGTAVISGINYGPSLRLGVLFTH
jgi:hypothetical protein